VWGCVGWLFFCRGVFFSLLPLFFFEDAKAQKKTFFSSLSLSLIPYIKIKLSLTNESKRGFFFAHTQTQGKQTPKENKKIISTLCVYAEKKQRKNKHLIKEKKE
jgi:hypothetical protein